MTTKTDIYKNENSYFLIGRKDVEGKLNKLVVEGYKLPWFESGDGKYILKVKFKNVKITDMMKKTNALQISVSSAIALIIMRAIMLMI